MAVDKPTQYTATIAKPPRIHDVKTKALRVVPDERGWLMEIPRADDAERLAVILNRESARFGTRIENRDGVLVVDFSRG